MSDSNKYQPDMERLKSELGRTPPPAAVSKLEDFAPKAKALSDAVSKAQQIGEGLESALEDLDSILKTLNARLDDQANDLARVHQLIADIKAII